MLKATSFEGKLALTETFDEQVEVLAKALRADPENAADLLVLKLSTAEIGDICRAVDTARAKKNRRRS